MKWLISLHTFKLTNLTHYIDGAKRLIEIIEARSYLSLNG